MCVKMASQSTQYSLLVICNVTANEPAFDKAPLCESRVCL